jgi:hypothetical protein
MLQRKQPAAIVFTHVRHGTIRIAPASRLGVRNLMHRPSLAVRSRYRRLRAFSGTYWRVFHLRTRLDGYAVGNRLDHLRRPCTRPYLPNLA